MYSFFQFQHNIHLSCKKDCLSDLITQLGVLKQHSKTSETEIEQIFATKFSCGLPQLKSVISQMHYHCV